MSRAGIERKLRSLSAEMRQASEELRVIDEQLAHFADSADDARLRSLVSETPLAGQEYREAAKTVTALQRDREVWARRVAELDERQNELLDQLLEASS